MFLLSPLGKLRHRGDVWVYTCRQDSSYLMWPREASPGSTAGAGAALEMGAAFPQQDAGAMQEIQLSWQSLDPLFPNAGVPG